MPEGPVYFLAFTSIFLGLASSALGMVSFRTPSWKLASVSSPFTSLGSGIERWYDP